MLYKGEQKLAFVDGGVFANNPSILAYAEAKELWKQQNKTTRKANVATGAMKIFDAQPTPDDNDLPFYLLSIGCGHSVTTVDYSSADEWRAKDWIKPLLTNVFMQSVSESTDYSMQYLLPAFEDGTPRYHRFNPVIPEANSQMDDTSADNIAALNAIAEKYVEDNKTALDNICTLLTQ